MSFWPGLIITINGQAERETRRVCFSLLTPFSLRTLCAGCTVSVCLQLEFHLDSNTASNKSVGHSDWWASQQVELVPYIMNSISCPTHSLSRIHTGVLWSMTQVLTGWNNVSSCHHHNPASCLLLLQMWYIIEASLPHAKLLNQTLILPSYIYAWGCKHEMWVQVLQYTIHHIYHICHIQRDLHKVCNHGKLRGCYRGWWMVWTSYGWADVSEWMLPSVTFDIHLCPFSRGWCCKCNIMEGGGRSPLNLDSLLFDIAALHVHYQ